MMKYLRIYKVLIENAFSYEAQYRKDALLQIFINFVWLGMLFLTIEIVFSHTEALGGFSREAVYLMTVFWVMSDELYTMFFKRNMMGFSSVVTDGDLDGYLLKPVSAIFLISTNIFLVRALYYFLIQLLLLAWLVIQFDFAVSPVHIVITALLLPIAALISYAFMFILNTGSFWFHRINNINSAWDSIMTMGRYPVTILPKTLKIIALTGIPIAFHAYIPVSILTGAWPLSFVAYPVSVLIILLVIMNVFWKFSVKRYSSASS